MDMHAGQLHVTAETVRELVDEQLPDWRDLSVRALDTAGTVNVLFQLGEGLVARFPMQPDDPAETRRSLEIEASAAHQLRRHSRAPTPEPSR